MRPAAPVRSGVRVARVARSNEGFVVETTEPERRFAARAVVIATGTHAQPWTPTLGRRIDPRIRQVHAAAYRTEAELPPGAVLVVGSGQSGSQIAEDLFFSGRQVHLSVGTAPRSPRRYR